MVLNDNEITERIQKGQLVQNHDSAGIRNCAYALRAGRVFQPDTGDELVLRASGKRKPVLWQIGPCQSLIVMTHERIHMPSDLCAFYAPLNRLARQGVMLLNPAIVEPGYEGPLSCFLVNFSSRIVNIAPGQPISKLVFHRQRSPASLRPQVISDDSYAQILSESAQMYHTSFMDVSGIEDRAAKKARGALKGWLTFFAIVFGLLVSWSAL